MSSFRIRARNVLLVTPRISEAPFWCGFVSFVQTLANEIIAGSL
jgi:hypothetical protein